MHGRLANVKYRHDKLLYLRLLHERPQTVQARFKVAEAGCEEAEEGPCQQLVLALPQRDT